MSTDNERRAANLSRIIGRELERTQGDEAQESERFLKWLAREARSNQTSDERNASELAADDFAHRLAPRIKAQRLDQRLPRQPLQRRAASAICGLREAIAVASASRCAPLLDLSVAAGSGRALWDEACESWIEVLPGIPDGRYLGLKVSGDSMQPLLESGDVILVKLDAVPIHDDLVVAQRSENEYVVKRVSAISDSAIELESLNRSHETFSLTREVGVILGTVVARFQKA
jgi:phage repressor protein C with HTH and peptisase S24 domain